MGEAELRPASIRDSGKVTDNSMAASLRIGFDARYVNDRYHGIGRYAFRLLEALVMQAPQHQFVVFTGQGVDNRFDLLRLKERKNVSIRSGPWPLYWPQEQLQWPALLRKASLDIFHTPHFAAPFLTRATSFRVITTIHDLIFDRYPEYMPARWLRPYYRELTKRSLKRASKVIVVSSATAADLEQYYSINSNRMVIIPEGVDPRFAPIADQDILAQVASRYRLRLPIILSVGVRRPHKNYTFLIKSYARMVGRIPHRLVIVGQQDSRFPDEARHTAEALNLGEKISFLEWVSEQDLCALYNLADLVVLPSLIEGFGLPALEAMACGTPVIAANNSSFPEVVGSAGLLVDPCDEEELSKAILRLVEDQMFHRTLAVKSLERSAEYQWQAIAGRMIAVYETVLS
jgi:glycosyltransferase involved in cell wall biosynthesis